MRKANAVTAVIIVLFLLLTSGCSQNKQLPDEPKQTETIENKEISSVKEEGSVQMETRENAQLDYLGHASIRIITNLQISF